MMKFICFYIQMIVLLLRLPRVEEFPSSKRQMHKIIRSKDNRKRTYIKWNFGFCPVHLWMVNESEGTKIIGRWNTWTSFDRCFRINDLANAGNIIQIAWLNYNYVFPFDRSWTNFHRKIPLTSWIDCVSTCSYIWFRWTWDNDLSGR